MKKALCFAAMTLASGHTAAAWTQYYCTIEKTVGFMGGGGEAQAFERGPRQSFVVRGDTFHLGRFTLDDENGSECYLRPRGDFTLATLVCEEERTRIEIALLTLNFTYLNSFGWLDGDSITTSLSIGTCEER